MASLYCVTPDLFDFRMEIAMCFSVLRKLIDYWWLPDRLTIELGSAQNMTSWGPFSLTEINWDYGMDK